MSIDRDAFEAEMKTLLAQARGDDAATLAVRTLGPEIQRLLWRVVSDVDQADDAFGIFSEMLWRGIGGFRGESSFRTWAYRLAWHSVSRLRRDPHARRGQRFDTGALERVVAEVRDATSAYRQTAVKDRMRALRDQLDPTDRAVVALRVDSGLSWRDVATVLADQGEVIQEAALRKRYERAKADLRRLAEEAGLKGKDADG